jgi:hypothetical protein
LTLTALRAEDGVDSELVFWAPPTPFVRWQKQFPSLSNSAIWCVAPELQLRTERLQTAGAASNKPNLRFVWSAESIPIDFQQHWCSNWRCSREKCHSTSSANLC